VSIPVSCPACNACNAFLAEGGRHPDRDLYLDCPQGHVVRVAVRSSAVTWEAVPEPRV
jgi:hypothetical protein